MTDAMQAGAAPGFFGKVAAHGDFVTRRLPPGFLGAWDRWLQHSLQKSREQLAHLWIDLYLTSPVWRFALAGGVCGEAGWAGIMMPSVDRVGRHFPLTIACALPDHATALQCIGEAQTWYESVEHLALQTLDKDFSLDAFDAGLTALPRMSVGKMSIDMPEPESVPAHRNCLQLAGIDALAPAIPKLLELGPSMTSFWWSGGSDHVAPSLLACEGLPAPASFSALLDAHWTQRGWQVHPR
jgi:type VI secretion system protein ImpM